MQAHFLHTCIYQITDLTYYHPLEWFYIGLHPSEDAVAALATLLQLRP